MKRQALIILGLALCLSASHTIALGGEEKVALQVRFAKGETFAFHRMIDVDVKFNRASGNEKPSASRVIIEVWTDAEVLAQKQEDNQQAYEIQETIKRVKSKVQTDTLGQAFNTAYDTDQPEEKAKEEPAEGDESDSKKSGRSQKELEQEMKRDMRQMVGEKIKYDLSERGNILRMITKSKDSVRAIIAGEGFFLLMFAPLPQEIAAGAAWTNPLKPGMGSMIGFPKPEKWNASTTSTCTEIKRADNKAVAVINSKINFNKTEPKDEDKGNIEEQEEAELDESLGIDRKKKAKEQFSLEVNVISLDGDGVMVFDLTNNRPVESTERWKMEYDMVSTKFTVESKSQMELSSPDKR